MERVSDDQVKHILEKTPGRFWESTQAEPWVEGVDGRTVCAVTLCRDALEDLRDARRERDEAEAVVAGIHSGRPCACVICERFRARQRP